MQPKSSRQRVSRDNRRFPMSNERKRTRVASIAYRVTEELTGKAMETAFDGAGIQSKAREANAMPAAREWVIRGLAAVACVIAMMAWAAPAAAQNVIANPGFENNPPPSNGNNIGWSFAPWVLGPGDQSNVVKVDGPGGFNYGNSGPQSDASNNGAGGGAGVAQHYADIVGVNDLYQSFTVPTCGAAPGQTRTATFSGWFSTRDNLAGNGAIVIRSGVGLTGAVLASQTINLPVPPLGSGMQPWVRVTGTVNLTSGAQISFVVDMDNNVNFDEASLTFSAASCASAPLTLRKTWTGAAVNDTATLTATRNGSAIDTLVSVANTASETDTDPTPTTVFQGETITLSETLAAGNAGLYASTLACTGGGTLSGSTLTVNATGTAIVCTYTNARRPRVTVTKVSNGGVGTFAFSGNNGFAAQTITTTTAGTGVAGATQTLTAASTSTTITEAAPPSGFVLSAIACTGLGTGGTATPTINGAGGGSVTLDALATAPGSNIACTFTNDALGSITIVKDAQPNNAQDFLFTSALAPGGNFTQDDDADATLSNTRTFTALTAGTYAVTEGVVAGWTLASITCNDADGGTTTDVAARTATIDVDPGQNITCTFVNGATGVADLQIAKTNNNTAPLVAGTTTTYVLTVTNNGPAAVNGAVVRDTPNTPSSPTGAGLNCPAANPVTCGPAAACPAGTTVGTLTGSGVTLGNIANGGVVTLTFTCNVQ